jgi:hypothetical protein
MVKLRKIVALTAAITLLNYNFAFAVCSDGSTLPAGGFQVGQPPIQTASNWSPGVFTGTTGSIFVPDNSTFEHNDPTLPLTGGGHNWVFDQGSTLCKETDTGPAGAPATGWSIPPNTPGVCIVLPVIRGGVFQNLGDIPFQGEAITPTCNPALLSAAGAPNPANTYFNQLGCSISHGVANTPQTATTFLFVAGIKGGLFSIPLTNVANPVVGGQAGKLAGSFNYYSQIPEGQKLTNAAVSNDGRFAVVTSDKRSTAIFACLNPLGDPGDPSLPLNPNFFVPPAGNVPCMQVGSNALAVDLTTDFGPDNQPYFGGQRVVNTFDATPGSSAANPVPSAWPQCITQGTNFTIPQAFAAKSSNHCGNAQPNGGFTAALITQPQAIIAHNSYMYSGPLGGTIIQFKVTTDPISGLSQYAFRTYAVGFSLVTGLGVAEDLQSLMIFSDPSALGLAGQEVVTKLPVCEDF